MDSEENVRTNHEQEPDTTLDPVTDQRVTDALDSLGTVEPPVEFVDQVMWRTRQRGAQQGGRRTSRQSGEGLSMARKALIGVIGMAAAGLLVAYIGGVPSIGEGTEGTIGAAQRYQSRQIASNDVKVDNADLQAFMQTEAFDQLIHDKQALAALASPSLQAALAAPGFTAALARPELRQALAASSVRDALASPAIVQALASPALQQALAAPAVQAALAAQGVQAAMARPELAAILAHAELAAVLASPAMRQALASPAFQQALASPAVQQALASAGFQQAMASPALQAALGAQGFQAALASPQFVQGLAAQGFVSELQAQALAASSGGAMGVRQQ